jgi:molybdenum cofactor cytidylyltransferase
MNLTDALRLDRVGAAPEVVSFVGAGGKSSAMFRLAGELTARGRRVIVTTTTRIAADQIRLSPAFASTEGGRLSLDEVAAALDRHGQCLVIGRDVIERGPGVKKAGIQPQEVDDLAARAPALGVDAILVEADGSRMLPVKAPDSHEPALPASTTLLVPVIGLNALGAPLDETHVQRAALIRSLLGFPAQGPARLTPAHLARLLIHPNGGVKNRPPGARCLALFNQVDDPPRLAAARLMAHLLAMEGYSALLGTAGVTERDPIRERWGPVAAIVLAAGESARLGRPKQLLVVEGETLVTRAVRTALESGAQQVIVVTGAWRGAVTETLTPLVAAVGGRLRLVHNEAWRAGQASSMQAGLAACAPGTEAALFMPVDQPRLDPALLRRLIGVWRAGARMATPAVDGQLRGAPGLFDRSLWPELMAVRGDTGGRPLLRRYRDQVKTVPTGAETLTDIDTLTDFRELTYPTSDDSMGAQT